MSSDSSDAFHPPSEQQDGLLLRAAGKELESDNCQFGNSFRTFYSDNGYKLTFKDRREMELALQDVWQLIERAVSSGMRFPASIRLSVPYAIQVPFGENLDDSAQAGLVFQFWGKNRLSSKHCTEDVDETTQENPTDFRQPPQKCNFTMQFAREHTETSLLEANDGLRRIGDDADTVALFPKPYLIHLHLKGRTVHVKGGTRYSKMMEKQIWHRWVSCTNCIASRGATGCTYYQEMGLDTGDTAVEEEIVIRGARGHNDQVYGDESQLAHTIERKEDECNSLRESPFFGRTSGPWALPAQCFDQ